MRNDVCNMTVGRSKEFEIWNLTLAGLYLRGRTPRIVPVLVPSQVRQPRSEIARRIRAFLITNGAHDQISLTRLLFHRSKKLDHLSRFFAGFELEL